MPSIGGVGLVYPGRRHVFSGPPESAKTLAAYAILVSEARQGGTALLLDLEMGPWDALERLRELGATDDDLDRVVYVEPDTAATEEIVEHVASSFDLTLVVVDAAPGAYSLQGLDDNKRQDVETFSRVYLRPFWLRGVATIVIDHVGKNASNRGAFAIGSERKVGGADVHIGFEAAIPIRRGGRGLYKLTTHKDRLGHLPRPRAAEFELVSDPETHAITWEFRAPEPDTEDTAWRPTHLMERVSKYLEGQRDGVSRTQVEKNVRGRAEYVRQAIDALVADGYVEESASVRGSRPVRSVRAYREGDSVPTSSPPRPDGVTDDPVPRPSLYERDGVTDSVADDPDEDAVQQDLDYYRDLLWPPVDDEGLQI
jgi:hypothetical protein